VRCKPRTGRTHQIRVHLNHIGHPIVADRAYSGRDKITLGELRDVTGNPAVSADSVDPGMVLIDRQALHAHALRFNHPITGKEVHLTAPLPADMARTLEALRAHRRFGLTGR
jgi:23S rRNA pseudouridine1911/1915/1917 synthase